MKNFIFSLIVLTAWLNIFGQKIFDVQDFSKDYYGKVYLESPTEVFSKGWIEIYQKKTNKKLIKVSSDELISRTENGIIRVNVKELPYGEQSLIIYEDFNFDGIKDFAVMDGQNSCYHGPSFQIFLGGKEQGVFRLSKSFTRLAQEYCGMFGVDAQAKKIYTMTKSGAGWHQYSDFVVQNNKPKAIKIVEEYYQGEFIYIATKTLKNGRMIASQERSFADADRSDFLFTFKLQNKKQLFLSTFNDELSYSFVDAKGKIELSLPLDAKNQKTNFILDSKDDSQKLSFYNGKYEYIIYEKLTGEIGIQVKGKNINSILVGDTDSKKGSLQNLVSQNLSNLTLKK